MNRRLYEVRKSLKMTQKQMAEILGIGQNAYSMIENGKIGLTTGNRIILESKLGINPEFLLEGTGQMLLKTAQNPTNEQKNPPQEEEHKGVPFFSKPISLSISSNLELNPNDIDYYIDYEPFNDCTFYRPVFGQNMAPRFTPADTVACKLVTNKNNIIYGQSYLCLIGSENDMYETIQILRKSEISGNIILTPLNPAFDSMEIPLDSIAGLYIIRGKIERTL